MSYLLKKVHRDLLCKNVISRYTLPCLFFIFLICIPTRCLEENIVIFNKLLKRDVVIPDFKGFCKTVENIYHNCKKNYNGQVACYIPQLARYSPDYWGVSIWYEIINIYLSTFNNWYIFFMARLVCTHT